MKRSTKIWLIVAGIMMGAGLLFITIGAACGGVRIVADWAMNGELNMFMRWNKGIKFDNKQTVYEGDVAMTMLPGGESAQELTVNAGSCVVRIERSEDAHCYFSSENAYQFQCYLEDGVLQLRIKSKSTSHGKTRSVTLYLPEEMELKEASFDVGAGTLRIQELNADKVSIDISAGKIEISKLTARRLSVDVGAGKATIKNGAVLDAEFDVNAGTLKYSGAITGDLEADVSAGTIEIDLEGAETDHNYDVDCSAGTIRIGDTSYSKEKYINNGSASEFELDVSAGKIIISFE